MLTVNFRSILHFALGHLRTEGPKTQRIKRRPADLLAPGSSDCPFLKKKGDGPEGVGPDRFAPVRCMSPSQIAQRHIFKYAIRQFLKTQYITSSVRYKVHLQQVLSPYQFALRHYCTDWATFE